MPSSGLVHLLVPHLLPLLVFTSQLTAVFNCAYLMYGNTSAVVGVGGVLLSGSFSMCPTVECILCSENVYTAHCMKQ